MIHYLALIPRERPQWRVIRSEFDLLAALASPVPFTTPGLSAPGCNRPGVRSSSFGIGAHSTAPLDPLSRTVTNKHGAQQHIGLVELGWRAYRELVG